MGRQRLHADAPVRSTRPSAAVGGVTPRPALPALMSLQRLAGNAAVATLVVQRQPAPAPVKPAEKQTGLGGDVSVGNYITAVKTALADWAKLKPQERADKAVAAANGELRALGVPACKARVSTTVADGQFRSKDWAIELAHHIMSRPTLDRDTEVQLATTIFHEARHAEQDFRMARLQAGKKVKAATIASTMQIRSDVAKAAVLTPLDAKSGDPKEVAEAVAWHEQQYGKGKREFDRRQRAVVRAKAGHLAAKQAWKKLRPGKAKQAAAMRMLATGKTLRAAHAKYVQLAPEADAFKIEAEVARRYREGEKPEETIDRVPYGK